MDVSPRGFEPRRMHAFLLDGSPVDTAQRGHRVRVVKELVLKANGLCPREFESRRCRTFFSSRSFRCLPFSCALDRSAVIAQLGER